MISRRQIRAKVLQALYAQAVADQDAQAVFDDLLADMHTKLKAQDERQQTQNQAPFFLRLALNDWQVATAFALDDATFLQRLYTLGHEQANIYDKMLAPLLQHWELDRLNLLDRQILYIGLTELIHMPSIPQKVVINEAIELAKEYGTENSARFVNGMLDRVRLDLNARQGNQPAGVDHNAPWTPSNPSQVAPTAANLGTDEVV